MTNQERYEEDLKIIPEGGSKTYVIDGFNACIRRHGYIGHLCGYVEVPDGLSVNIDEIDCHGGVTFNDHWSEFPTDGYYIVLIACTSEIGTQSWLKMARHSSTTLTKTVSLS